MDVDTRLRAARRSHADVKPPWRPSPKAGGGNEYPPSSRVTSAVSPRIQHDDFWRNTPSQRQAARSDAARHIKILAPLLDEAVGPAPRRLCVRARSSGARLRGPRARHKLRPSSYRHRALRRDRWRSSTGMPWCSSASITARARHRRNHDCRGLRNDRAALRAARGLLRSCAAVHGRRRRAAC